MVSGQGQGLGPSSSSQAGPGSAGLENPIDSISQRLAVVHHIQLQCYPDYIGVELALVELVDPGAGNVGAGGLSRSGIDVARGRYRCRLRCHRQPRRQEDSALWKHI